MHKKTMKAMDGTVLCRVVLPIKRWAMPYKGWTFAPGSGLYTKDNNKNIFVNHNIFKLRDKLVRPKTWNGKLIIDQIPIHHTLVQVVPENKSLGALGKLMVAEQVEEPSKINSLANCVAVVKKMSPSERKLMEQVLAMTTE